MIRSTFMALIFAIVITSVPGLAQVHPYGYDITKSSVADTGLPGEKTGATRQTNADGTLEEPAEEVAIPILCYHRFEDVASSSYAVTPEAFEDQMEYLQSNGFHSISLETLANYASGSLDFLPPKPVVITIDDGWKSAYTKAVPILKEKGFTATFFVYTDFISSCRNSLSWEDLQVLLKENFDVGSHTKSHPNFLLLGKRLDSPQYQKRVSEELSDSRKLLAEELGTSVALFSYPYGVYDSYLEHQIGKCGYKIAVTTNSSPNSRKSNKLCLSRFTMLRDYTLDDFARIVTSGALLTEAWEPKDSSTIRTHRPLISARIVDEDIDAGSLRMRLGEILLPATFNPITGQFGCQITKSLKDAAHIVAISAKEKTAGKLKFASWLFIVDTTTQK